MPNRNGRKAITGSRGNLFKSAAPGFILTHMRHTLPGKLSVQICAPRALLTTHEKQSRVETTGQ